MEDPTSRGRFSRKKSNADFIEQIKTSEEGQPEHQKKRRKRKTRKPQDLGDANWDGDREVGDEKKRRKSKYAILLPSLAGGGLIAVVMVIIAVSFKGLQATQERGTGAPPTTSPVSDSIPFDFEEANRTMKLFLDAPSVDEMVKYVRQPDRVVPLVERYYEKNPYQTLSWSAPTKLDGLPVDGNFLEIVIDINGLEKRPIVLERVGDQFKVDWECWVAYSEMPWEDFIEQRKTEPWPFRVMIGPDSYYNHKFSDALDYRCFQIQDQMGNHVLYGYVTRGSDTDRLLRQAFRKFPYGCAIVKLQFPSDNPADTQGNQVIISEFMRFGWVDRSASR